MTPVVAARKAAKAAFDVYRGATRSRGEAVDYIPDYVMEVAKTAYRAAGGKRRLVVYGIGNPIDSYTGVDVVTTAR